MYNGRHQCAIWLISQTYHRYISTDKIIGCVGRRSQLLVNELPIAGFIVCSSLTIYGNGLGGLRWCCTTLYSCYISMLYINMCVNPCVNHMCVYGSGLYVIHILILTIFLVVLRSAKWNVFAIWSDICDGMCQYILVFHWTVDFTVTNFIDACYGYIGLHNYWISTMELIISKRFL